MGKLSALWDLAKKEGADLADDAASRMARAAEQGYGDTFYHATDKDFTEFMPSGWRGTNSFAPTPEGAIRGANSGGAEHVAIAGAGNPNTIYPVRMRGKIYGQDAPPDWWLPESVTYGEYRDILAKNKELPIPDEIAAQLNQNQIEQLQYMRRNDALNNYKEGVPESEWGKYAVYNDKGMVIDTSADMPMKLATEYTPPKPFMYQDIEGPQGYKSSWVDDYPGDRRDLLQKIGYTGARVDDEGGKSISMFDPSAIRSVNAAFDPAKKDSANLLAGLGGAAVLGGSLAPEDAEAGVITKVDDATGAVKRLIEAWHGSPHSFDKFDISKIGTGEGAQAYGHGLYFADAKDTAVNYRNQLSEGKRREILKNRLEMPPGYDYEAELFVNQLDTNKGNVGSTLDDLKRYAESFRSDGDQQTYNRLMGFHGRVADKYPRTTNLQLEDNLGALYRTEIDVDPDTLLDWDKPLSEQSPKVRALLNEKLGFPTEDQISIERFNYNAEGDGLVVKAGDGTVRIRPGENGVLRVESIGTTQTPRGTLSRSAIDEDQAVKVAKGWLTGDSVTGEQLHQKMFHDARAEVGANNGAAAYQTKIAEKLRETGIPGIRYRDQMSRNTGGYRGASDPAYDHAAKSFLDSGVPYEEAKAGIAQAYPDGGGDVLRALDNAYGVDNATYNYVMFDDKPISIVERGSADPALLGAIAVGAATTTALAPEMYRQMEETRRVVSDFAQRRAPKASFWKQKRDELLELAGAGIGAAVSAGINTVASNPLTSALAFQGGRYLKASEQPVQGVSALSALIASGDLDTAANVARMPQEAIADEAGGLVTDYLSQAGYPRAGALAGTAVNTGINMAGF